MPVLTRSPDGATYDAAVAQLLLRLVRQVLGMMRSKVKSLKESIERYRPRDPTKRSSLAEELQFLEDCLVESRRVLSSVKFAGRHTFS